MSDRAVPTTPEDGSSPNIGGSFLAVVYDNYQDPAFLPLPGAVAQVEELAETLTEFGYHGTILRNPQQGSLIDGLDQWSDAWSTGGGPRPPVVAWSGPAAIDSPGDLHPATHATPPPRINGTSPRPEHARRWPRCAYAPSHPAGSPRPDPGGTGPSDRQTARPA